MIHTKLKLCAAFLFGFGAAVLHAQEAIPASGGNASGSGGSVSFSLGQIFYTTNSGANGSAAQGVQQPYEISVVTATPEAEGIRLICQAYPNPASENVTLKVENYKKGNLTCELYNSDGKLIETQELVSDETYINMRNLVIATYFLKIRLNNTEVKTFKIIKF